MRSAIVQSGAVGTRKTPWRERLDHPDRLWFPVMAPVRGDSVRRANQIMSAAVVIIDVQKAILSGKGSVSRQRTLDSGLDAVVGRLQSLQRRARAAGVPVVLVQHDGDPGHRLETGTSGWEIRPELVPQPGEAVVHKRAADSFFETDLSDVLARSGATHLIIGGCMTQFCVDTTVRRAVSLGYDVTLIADGHTTADSGGLPFSDIIAHHNATLNGFDAGPAVVTVTEAEKIVF